MYKKFTRLLMPLALSGFCCGADNTPSEREKLAIEGLQALSAHGIVFGIYNGQKKATRKINSKEPDLLYTCKHCLYEAGYYGRFQKHTRNVHDISNPSIEDSAHPYCMRYLCPKCDGFFSSKNHLRQHKGYSHPEVNPQHTFKCYLCSFSTDRKNTYRRHNKTQRHKRKRKTEK